MNSSDTVINAERKMSFTDICFILVVLLSYLSLWYSTVYSRYKNAELYAIFQVPYTEITTTDVVFGGQILLVLIFILIFIIHIGNFKNIVKNKRFIFYALMLMCCPYLILKSENSLSYVLSISNGSVQLGLWTVVGIGLFFYVYNPDNWNTVIKALKILSIVIFISAIYGLVNYYSFVGDNGVKNRIVALKWLWTSAICLQYILAFWLLRIKATKTKKERIFGLVLVILQILLSLLIQTRLVLIMSLFAIVLYFYKVMKNKSRLMTALIAISTVLIGVYGLYLAGLNMPSFIDNFFARAFVDTRSSDLIEFFKFISNDFFSFFPLGAGYSHATDFQVDSGVLNTFFMTGIIMFSMAFLLLILPVLKLGRGKLTPEDAFVWVGAIVWAIRFCSSSTMAFTTEFLIFIIFAGRCAWLLDNKKTTNSQIKNK